MDLTTAIWRRSSFSSGNGGQCVEVAANLPGVVALRDSKNPDGPALVIDAGTFAAFLAGVRAGEFG
jgi:hypothetical protein